MLAGYHLSTQHGHGIWLAIDMTVICTPADLKFKAIQDYFKNKIQDCFNNIFMYF